MKIINLDELELKCIEYGIKNDFFTREELGKDNKFLINIRSTYHAKTIDIQFVNDVEISLSSETWENLYYKIIDFFRPTWDYTNPIDLNKAPLTMQITETLNKKSINGTVKLRDVYDVIVKKL